MSRVTGEEILAKATFSVGEQQRIRAHLNELLLSQPFAGSRRRQDFLRYVVEETLAGRGSGIREASIATDVFGRGPEFESNGGSIVRVTGGDVRKGLTQAYTSVLEQALRIELPVGSYQPIFHFASRQLGSQPEAAPQPVSELAPGKSSSTILRRYGWLAAALGIVIIVGTSALLLGTFQPPTSLDLLWRPFLDKDRPVLMSIVAPTLLKLNPYQQSKYLPLDPSKSIPSSELVVLKDSFVGTGGAMGAARFAEVLTSHKQRFYLKFGSDLNFADLKNSATILIGVSVLSQQVTRNARFQLKIAEEGISVVDSKQPERVWALPRRNYASPPRAEGYSLVTRILHSETGRPILLIAGMDSNNTQAAVEFLSNNDLFRQFSDSAPADWTAKNFQIVSTTISTGTRPDLSLSWPPIFIDPLHSPPVLDPHFDVSLPQ